MKFLRMAHRFRHLLHTYRLWLLLAGLAGGLAWFYQNRYREDARQKVETLRSRVWRELAATAGDQRGIEAAYRRTLLPGPAVLGVAARHPYCIFRDGVLVYWSDHRLVPAYGLLAAGPPVRVAGLPTGRFLVRRHAFRWRRADVEVFSLIALQRRFKVENEYLQTGVNTDLIPYAGVQLGTEISRNGANIYSPDAAFLFSVELPDQTPEARRTVFFGFFSVAVLLAVAAAFGLHGGMRRLRARGVPWWREAGFIGLAVYLLAVRWAMLRYSVPGVLVETDLFNPKYYASSAATPSFGDLLLNSLAALGLAAFAVRHFHRSRVGAWALRLPVRGQWGLAVAGLLVCLGLLSLHFYFLRTLSLYSQVSLDITESIRFPGFRLVCLLVFVCNSLLFFLGGYVVLRLLVQFRLPVWAAAAALGVAVAVYAGVAYAAYELHSEILIGGGAYCMASYYFGLPRQMARLSYRTSLYFFLTAALCAALGAWAIYELGRDQKLAEKADFARQLLAENDPLGEFLLSEAAEGIRTDAFIQSRFVGPFVSKQDIMRKARRYLGSYFDRYEVGISVFDPSGLNLEGDDYPQSYADYVVNFQRVENGRFVYGTAYDHLYFMPSTGGPVIRQYVSLITVLRQGAIIGFVVLDLQQKRVAPTDVYPGLLLDKRLVASPAVRTYSYALYDGGKLLYRVGDFNYERDFGPRLRTDGRLFGQSLVSGGYQHVGLRNHKGRLVVVSSPRYRVANVFSNFSFLFITLVGLVGLYVIGYTFLVQTPSARTGFATRIQLYLNLAFFLPLITVSVVTVSLLSANYRENLTHAYLEVAGNVSNEMRFRLRDFLPEDTAADFASPELNELARYTRSDVNLFGADGKLLITSQRQIYDDQLLSPYINRQAWHAIARQGHLSRQLPETVGRLHYNSVYAGIRNPDTQQLQGILSIPFFDARTDLDAQIIDVLSTILNIFTFIFLGFLVLSYFASRILTVPLRLITQKLGKTSLQGENEPLAWHSDDEIGLLVQEYNRMLRNLEASKEALGRSEKESAWREMAQQVAHEIKNPLTPMKLTLQHLQRTLKSPETLDRAERSIGTLLEQVDTLSDIATSFSAFAKMPIPKHERFDVAAVLRQTVELYRADPAVRLETDIAEGSYAVYGDSQLMGRIFTNLILNGLQSVPAGRQPCIRVSLHRQNGHVIIAVRDNGGGIADSIRAKVFLPHFSTRSSGSGIGLSVAKRGVEHAGGQIWFETEDGQGTAFFVQLPLA